MVRFLLILYRKFNIWQACRFYPSCSHYAEEAIGRHGLISGGFMALKRLIRCNQWFPGGYDPVPVGKSVFGVVSPKRDVSRETFLIKDAVPN